MSVSNKKRSIRMTKMMFNEERKEDEKREMYTVRRCCRVSITIFTGVFMFIFMIIFYIIVFKMK